MIFDANEALPRRLFRYAPKLPVSFIVMGNFYVG